MITAASKLDGTDYSRYLSVDHIDEETTRRAKEIFTRYAEAGVITDSCFEDNIWSVTDEKSRTAIRFTFSDIEFIKHAQNWLGCSSQCYRDAIKVYIAFHFGTLVLVSLREIASCFCNLASADFPYEGWFGDKTNHVLGLLRLLPGISATREEAVECLKACLATRQDATSKQRKLLNFKAYFCFNDELESFWTFADEEEKLYYFPLYLWWKLTAVLPLRVTEFLMIPKDCIRKVEKGYLLTVRRTRLKGGNTLLHYRIDSDYEKKTYPVSYEIAKDILWFQNTTKEMPVSPIDALFCCEPYRKHHRLLTGKIYDYDCLNTTKDDFYRNVLDEKGVPVVHLGDTRHIAMMNLIITGGSPSLCMELAGHSNIDISSHYYTNMAELVECSTYELYRKSKKGASARIYGKNIYSIEPISELTQIPDGWCSSPKRRMEEVDDCILAVNPLGEIGDCKSCQFFRSDRQGQHFDFMMLNRVSKKYQLIVGFSCIWWKQFVKELAAMKIYIRLCFAYSKAAIITESVCGKIWRLRMARPRKTNSNELIEILDAFFTTEAAGNPAKLKCSLLEEYAAKLGKQIKAYDFRRDEKVRQRIEELKELVRNENGMGIQLGNPYKNLDVIRIMKARQNPDALRTALGELDDYWRYIYESTLKIRLDAGTIAAEKTKLEKEFVALRQENETLTKKYTDSKSENRKLTVENRYLKKMLRTYLYPALANEILTEENQIKNPDTEVTPHAKDKLIDGIFPSSVSSIFSEDRGILSQEEELLKQMWDSIPGGTV